MFYAYITNPLIFSGACPYFVTCYGVTTTCTFGQMFGLLQGKVKPRLSDTQIQRNMLRNASFMLGYAKGNRPNLTDSETPAGYIPDATRMHYGALLTQSMAGAPAFSDWLIKPPKPFKEVCGVLFQIAIATYALYLTQAVHNDLHIGNMFIKEHEEKPVVYQIDADVYEFRPRWVPYLYDFDRSYAVRLGLNGINNAANCEAASQCNIIQNNKDIIKSMCYIAHIFPSWKNTIIEIICIPGREYMFEVAMSDPQCFFRTYEGTGKAIPNQEFTKSFKPVTQIILELYTRSNFKKFGSDFMGIATSDIHCLDPRAFNPDGTVNRLMVGQCIKFLYGRY